MMNQMSNAGRALALLASRHRATLKVSSRVKAYIQTEANTVKDLNSVIQSITPQQDMKSLLGSVEDRLLTLLTNVDKEDDDMVSQFIVTPKVYDYDSLCKLFILLAENRRRPTPLLKVASVELSKLASSTEAADKPRPEIIISTLSSLISLSYPNRTLISKLIDDLTATIKFEQLDSYTLCNLLRTIGTLRWRPDELLKILFNFIRDDTSDCKAIDHHVIVALLHVAATVNYQPEEGMEQFYQKFVKGSREQMLDRSSRKWLNYVWSLVALEIADETHIRSVLSDEFYSTISTRSDSLKVNHSDIMKLLNLRAIAQYELRLENLNCEHLRPLLDLQIQRSTEMQKFATKINESLKGIVNSPTEIKYAIQTPFGFVIDSILMLSQDLETIPLDHETTDVFKESFENFQTGSKNLSSDKNCQQDSKRCALIYVSYKDTLVNYEHEVVGHKRMISRILKNFGFETKFLPETLINREKTSADLTNRLKLIIKSLSDDDYLG